MSIATQVVALALAYVALAILALAAMIRLRWPWRLTAGIIVLVSLAYLGVFQATKGLLGWSTWDKPPAHFQVLWAYTVEPSAAIHEPGAVHLWLQTLDDENLPVGEPRAYRLPYSRRLARTVETVRTEIQGNHPQEGRTIEAEGTGNAEANQGGQAAPLTQDSDPGGDPAMGGNLDPALLGSGSRPVAFAPLPRPRLPPKDTP